MPDIQRSRSAGFTLTELAVVMVVMSAVLATSVPSLSGWMGSRQLDRSLNLIESKLDSARHKAISQNNPYEVVFSEPTASQFVLHDDDDANGAINNGETVLGPYDLPKGFRFDDMNLTGDERIIFMPSGMLATNQGGELKITDDKGRVATLEIFASGTVERSN